VQEPTAIVQLRRDRVVITQTINSAAYARKLLASMPDCPCHNMEMELNKASNANGTEASLLQKGAYGSETLQIHRDPQWHDSEGVQAAQLEDYPEKNFSAKYYTLSNKAQIEEMGVDVGAVALRITMPVPEPGQEVAIQAAGGTLVTYNDISLKAHSPGEDHGRLTMTPRQVSRFERRKDRLSGSDVLWNRFSRSWSEEAERKDATGEVLITETGAEDLIRLKIDVSTGAWKVKTGHILATTDRVKLKAEWVGVKRDSGIEAGFMVLALYSELQEEDHFAWIWGYGKLRHHVLREGETLTLDDGHLIAMKKPMRYSIAQARGMLGAPNGGDGLLLHFRGPVEIVSTSKNIRHYARYLCPASVGV